MEGNKVKKVIVTKENPGCLVQLLWFALVGWWVGEIWIAVAWFLMVTVIGAMCVSAYNAVAPDIWLFSLGGEHPWDKDKDITEVVCPDPNVGLVFEVRRVR